MTVTVQEAIYRAKVEGQQSVDNMARSVDGLAVSEEKLTRATRASEQGFERLVAKVDPAARAQQQYQRTIEQVARYEAAGIGSMQQRAQVIQLATARFEQQTRAMNIGAAANDNFAARTGLAGYAVRNLGFQLNDVGTMLAMGASPFQVLASQGGQVYQILGSSERGVGGAIKGMAASVAAFLGPLGMLAAGLTAAAAAGYAFYSLTKKEGPTSEKLLEEHARLLGVIKDAYDNATKATKNWYEQSKEVTQLQLMQQQIDLTDKLRESTGKLIQTTLQKDFASFFGFDDPAIAKKFAPFADAIYTANEALQAGQPAVRGFVDEVARIGLANPELQKMAGELIASAKNAGEFEIKLKQIRDMLTLINGGKLSSEQTQGIGLGSGGASKQVNAYDQLIQRTKDRVEQLKLEAEGYGKTTEAVIKLKLQQEAERAARQAGVSVNQKVIDQLGDELVLLEKQKKLRGLQDSIEFDRDTMFFTDKERDIAREMKDLYGPEWQKNMDSVEAKQLRINNAMREMRDTAVDFAQSFVQGMMAGKSASDALIGALDQLGKKMMNTGIERGINGLFSGDPAEMAGGAIQAGIGWGLQQFQKRELEKEAAAKAEAERLAMIAERNRAKKSMIEQYTLRGNLAGLDQSTQAGALEAFDLRAASELKQASRTPGIGRHELVVAEAALAKERLKIIEDFAKQALELERSYEDRIFAAQNDTSTLDGSLAAFDRAAAREREQAVEAGGIAIEKLEQALAAERLRVIQDFVGKANAAEARRLAYADRLFAATTDMTTLQGALSAFDRAAQREREEEIASGGEAILDLEAALNAERLQVIQSFNSRIVDDTKQAEEQRRAALIQTTQQVLQYINQLQTGTASPLSPGARLSAAQASYDSTRALAAGGNEEAYGQFTQVAEQLRTAAQAMYGSAAGYQTVFNQIVADGLNLTSPTAAADPVVAKLQDVVTAIGIANGSIVSKGDGNVAAINAVTGAVDLHRTSDVTQFTNTRTTIGATTTAVGGTTTAVTTQGTNTTGAVTTGNNIANDQVDIAEDQITLLEAIQGLGAIQRNIADEQGELMASIGTDHSYWLAEIRRYTRRTADGVGSGSGGEGGGTVWDWLGFEKGGVVGNGTFGRDSVMARYSGGGNIMLAGGEGVLTSGATAAIGGRAAIDYINRTGMLPANDNGGVVAAIENMNRNLSAMLARIASLEEKNANLTAQLLQQNSEWKDNDDRKGRKVAAKAGRAA